VSFIETARSVYASDIPHSNLLPNVFGDCLSQSAKLGFDISPFFRSSELDEFNATLEINGPNRFQKWVFCKRWRNNIWLIQINCTARRVSDGGNKGMEEFFRRMYTTWITGRTHRKKSRK